MPSPGQNSPARSARRQLRGLRGTAAAAVGLVCCVGLAPALAAGPASPPAATQQADAAQDEAGRAIVLRPARIDLELDGRLLRSVERPVGPIDVATVVRLVGDSSWGRVDGTVVTLSSGIKQAPDTHLLVAAPTVTSLRLDSAAGGTGWLRGSRARVSFTGTEVIGWDRAAGAASAPSPTRGFLAYTNGSTVEMTGTTFSNLGRQEDSRTGVTLARAAVTISDTRFLGNEVGLNIRQPSALQVANVEVAGSATNGLEVEGVQGGTVEALAARDNGGAGAVVSHGGSGLRLLGAVSERNAFGGVLVEGQESLEVGGLTTTGNLGPGISIESSRGVAVSGLRSTDDVEGLAATGTTEGLTASDAVVSGSKTGVRSGASTVGLALSGFEVNDVEHTAFDLAGQQLSVTDATVRGAASGVDLGGVASGVTLNGMTIGQVTDGVVVKKQATGVTLGDVVVEGADTGIALAGSQLTVRGGALRDTKTGVRIYGSGKDVLVDGATVVNAGVGVLATSSTSGVTLRDLTVEQRTGVGISTSSPNLTLAGGSVTGGLVGLDLHGGPAQVEGTVVSQVDEGVRVGRGGTASLVDARVDAVSTALRTGADSTVTVTDSRLWAGVMTLGSGDVSFVGENDLPPAPMPWYGLAGIIAAVSAIALEAVRRLRELEPDWAATAAAHITNRS